MIDVKPILETVTSGIALLNGTDADRAERAEALLALTPGDIPRELCHGWLVPERVLHQALYWFSGANPAIWPTAPEELAARCRARRAELAQRLAAWHEARPCLDHMDTYLG